MIKYKKHKVVKPRRRSYKTTRKTPLKVPQGVSGEEIDLRNAIAYSFPGMPIYESNRTVLDGREIDIWIPSKKVGIEYDGLRFHTGEDKGPKYHLDKTLKCERKGIKLIHVFSDEWLTRRPLVLDLINKTLGKYKVIEGSTCQGGEVSLEEGNKFLKTYSILGVPEGVSGYVGVFKSTNLLAVCPYKETPETLELLGYQEALGIKITQGVSKCLESLYVPPQKSLLARVDRRFSRGEEFKEGGFVPKEATFPKIYYTKDFKSKIPSEGYKLTEKQIQKYGLRKIYDCGEIILEKKNPSN